MQWILLTMGSRPGELRSALTSIADDAVPGRLDDTIVVVNGASVPELDEREGVQVIEAAANLGVPGGRDLAVRAATAPLVGFLDDDALLRPGATERILDAFLADPELGAVALRIVDERGHSSRRHVPRIGRGGVAEAGEVALFLGGACAIRRAAYDDAGGYFTELFYGHEEVELAWRLIDRGWRIRYLPDVEVFHPRTDISRHPDGWALTGRNRVWIARRTLPWPVAVVHVAIWLLVGSVRAPNGECRRQYLRGWWAGWRGKVGRNPIRWSTVWKLARLGRPPIV